MKKYLRFPWKKRKPSLLEMANFNYDRDKDDSGKINWLEKACFTMEDKKIKKPAAPPPIIITK